MPTSPKTAKSILIIIAYIYVVAVLVSCVYFIGIAGSYDQQRKIDDSWYSGWRDGQIFGYAKRAKEQAIQEAKDWCVRYEDSKKDPSYFWYQATCHPTSSPTPRKS